MVTVTVKNGLYALSEAREILQKSPSQVQNITVVADDKTGILEGQRAVDGNCLCVYVRVFQAFVVLFA